MVWASLLCDVRVCGNTLGSNKVSTTPLFYGMATNQLKKMKKVLLLTLLISCISFIISCDKNDNPEGFSSYELTESMGVEFNSEKTELIRCPISIKGKVTIPNTITHIRSGAFYECIGITGISIPNSVISIETGAFYGCVNLKEVRLEDGSKELKTEKNFSSGNSSLFGDCPLTSVYIGRDLYSTSEPFAEIITLKNITIGNTISSIGGFKGCTGIKELLIPNNITEIGSFSGCKGIERIEFPTKINTGDGVFMNCTALQEVVIPTGDIGGNVFSGCTSLKKVVTGARLYNYQQFKDCTALSEAILSGTEIWGNPFEGCVNLRKLTIGNPQNTTYLLDYSYLYPSIVHYVTNLTLCGNLRGTLFKSNTTYPLEELTVNKEVTSIYTPNCPALKKIHCMSNTPPNYNVDNFNKTDISSCIIYIPKGALSAYQEHEVWGQFENIQEVY